MRPPIHILVVDDHPEILELLQTLLEQHGFRASTASNGREMRSLLNKERVDLIVLDIMLPGDDGLTLCKALRSDQSAMPIIMLTARGDEIDRVVGLELGADDYMAKPFSGRELVARIKAILRRAEQPRTASGKEQDCRFRFGNWVLDTGRRELETGDGTVVALSTAEYRLLRSFLTHPQIVLSRDRLMDLSRTGSGDVFDRSVDLLVSRLRRKLGDSARNPELIKTVWGDGYIFTKKVLIE